jgi:aminopeptidase N
LRTMLKDADGKSQGTRTGKDEPFVKALRRVREKYEGQAINTKQLLDAFSEELPPALRYEGHDNLNWFLDGWVNGISLPKLEIKGTKFTSRGKSVAVTGTILQQQAPPDLVTSVPLYAVVPGKTPVFVARVFADGEESSFRLTAPAGTRKLLLDPYNTILSSPK